MYNCIPNKIHFTHHPLHANLQTLSFHHLSSSFHSSHLHLSLNTSPLSLSPLLPPFSLSSLNSLSQKMADQSQRQDNVQLRAQDYHQRAHERGQDLQQRGQEAVQSFKEFLQQKSPSTSNVIAYLTVFPLGVFLLGLSGVAFIGSLLGLAVTGPLFLLFSPVIVPALLTVGLAVMGFLTSGAFGITGLSAFSWIINYLRGVRAGDTGTSMEHVSRWAHQKAGDMGQRVKEMGQDVADRARDTGREA